MNGVTSSPRSGDGWPAWCRTSRLTARAAWDARGEEVSALASRLARQLRAYDEILGRADAWTLVDDDSTVSADASMLGAVMAVRVHRDAENVAFPAHGHVLSVAREAAAGFLAVRLRVGSSRVVKRMPANSVQVTIAGPFRNGERRSIDPHPVEGVLRGLVIAWEPDSAAVFDDDGASAAEGRGKFAPVIGQRTWVSDRIGEVETATSGVRTHHADDGCYLFADDALDSKSAVHEVWSTLQTNGVTAIARATPTYPS
jgi:hypothetical protein